MKLVYALFFVITLSAAVAQPYTVPQVPHKLNFAGITLSIRDEARREIQKDVDALWRSPKHFNIKAERAKTYFPIIEKIFAEERVPDDFKYLVLQESALIADAVSVSNAVGFWQFKDFTAMEVGLRVDETIDERMNIASATRGAAKYIKKNNYQFNNWVYALQAYQMGAGGVLRSVEDTESGTKHMDITSKTYWYVKKFLAHKIAFENAVNSPREKRIDLLGNVEANTLAELANTLSIDTGTLYAFNKWSRTGIIPRDRTYAIVVPASTNSIESITEKVSTPANQRTNTVRIVGEESLTSINGVPVIKSRKGETLTSLANRAGITLPTFMRYNDLQGHEKLLVGAYYFTKQKKPRASQSHMIAKKGEDLWLISQTYGVALKKLKKFNRTSATTILEGQTIWLSSKMSDTHTRLNTSKPISSDDTFFSWGTEAPIEKEVESKIPSLNITEITPPPPSTSPKPSSIYTVSAGENLYDIAKSSGLSIEDLVKWNNLGNNITLYHGQILTLTAPLQKVETDEKRPLEHVVKPSDTLYSIAREYGVTIKELLEWNQKQDFSLKIGEKLKLFKN